MKQSHSATLVKTMIQNGIIGPPVGAGLALIGLVAINIWDNSLGYWQTNQWYELWIPLFSVLLVWLIASAVSYVMGGLQALVFGALIYYWVQVCAYNRAQCAVLWCMVCTACFAAWSSLPGMPLSAIQELGLMMYALNVLAGWVGVLMHAPLCHWLQTKKGKQ